MIHGTLGAFAADLHGEMVGGDASFTGVCTDTRQLEAGQLFFALQGPHRDGHAFVANAVRGGAAAAVVTRALPGLPVPQLVVADTLQALGALGRAWLQHVAPTVIAITGSNGKTTVKNMLAAILAREHAVLATAGNFNNHIGVPLTLARLTEGDTMAVIETGCSQPGDIAALGALIDPHVAVVTNAAAAHVEGLGNIAGVAREKGALFAALRPDGCAVLNADDAWADDWRSVAGPRRRQLTFGFAAGADVRVDDFTPRRDGGARVRLGGHLLAVEVELRLGGRHNAANAAAAAAAALAAGASADAVRDGLAAVAPAPGRLQRQVLGGGVTLIDDSYNANPASMRAAIDFTAALPGRAWAALGAMSELGASAAAEHADLGRYAAQAGVERLFALGAATAPLVAAARAAGMDDARCFDDHQALADAVLDALAGEVNVLVKGSRSAAMERVAGAVRQGWRPAAPGGATPC